MGASSLLALTAALLFGAADFTGGQASRRTPVATVALVTNLVGVALGVALVVAIGGSWSAGAVLWGAAGGACGLGGVLLLYHGLATGPNRIVSPISAVVAAAIPVVVGVAAGERPGALALAGLAVAPVAIWLVTGGDLRAVAGARRSALVAIGAGIGFGLFFVGLAQSPDDAGAVPLLAARGTSTSLLAAAALARRRAPRPHRADLSLAALAGGLDMTANGLFLWSTLDGDLAVVGALVSLFPVTTILLAVVVLGERTTRRQAVGLVLAVGSAALLS